MSISTTKGDQGFTSLSAHSRVSKTDFHIEVFGNVDELISSIGFARSICEDSDIAARYKEIQRELFLLMAAVAPSPEETVELPVAAVARLTENVHRLERMEGILSDWSIPGEHTGTAAIDVARTVCRRAERSVIRLRESGITVAETIPAYLNRLSDYLWISARAIELNCGRDAALREAQPGKRWSRAW